jgi:menaquinone-specific isochorismate synthase
MTTVETIQAELAQALKKKLHALPSHPEQPTFHRATIQVQGIDLLHWLNGQTAVTRIFWSRRDEPLQIAAIGAVHHLITDSMSVLQSVRRNLHQADQESRYFGGMRFDPRKPIEEVWQPFAKYHFVMPRFELVQEAEEQRLAINFLVHPEEDLLELFTTCGHDIERLAPESPLTEDALPDVVNSEESPNSEEWAAMIENALEAIRRQELEKIVLASKTTLTFNDTVNPLLLLKLILKKNGRTFHFAFQFQRDSGFIGMSPECLFRRKNELICTEAIASTRRRGSTADEDDLLGAEMLASDKDQREHRLVKKMILDRLSPFCRDIRETSDETLLKLTHVQHLLSEFQGELKENVHTEQVLAALHPTPAVGGYPKIEAVERIAQLEPFDRGWYAAPVGWVSKDEAEFAVAIRSAVTRRNVVHVYAGSGIVEGSDPLKEWEENRNKAKNFMQHFETV